MIESDFFTDRKLPKGPPYIGRGNIHYTRSLFYEVAVKTNVSESELIRPVFTLNEPRKGYICARDTFLELRDVTGRRWAEKYLKSFTHFKTLLQSKWFREAFEEWVEEVKDHLRMEALEKIQEIASGETSQAFQAAKYLADKAYDTPERSKRGRPSKEEIKGELAKAVKTLSIEEEDMQRIGLRVVGGKDGD